MHQVEGAMLGLEWSERCRYSAEVINIATEVGLPVYVTHLEQIFGSCEVCHVDDLMKHCYQASSFSSMKDVTSYGQATQTSTEVEHRPQERICTSLLEERESAEMKVQQSLRREGAESLGSGAVRTKREYSFDKIHLKLESFLEKRDTALEEKLKQLFDAAQTMTAKENLLLSLR